MRVDDVPKEVHARGEGRDPRAAPVEFEVQLLPQKAPDRRLPGQKLLPPRREEDQVIDVPDVVPGPKLVLDEPVQAVQVDVREELARVVPDGEAISRRRPEEALARRHPIEEMFRPPEDRVGGDVPAHDALAEPLDRGRRGPPGQEIEEPIVVDRRKEAPDVEVRVPGLDRMVPRDLGDERAQPFTRRVRPLALAAREAVVDEAPLPDRLERPHEEVVDDPVPEIRRADLPALRLQGNEADRTTGPVPPRLEVPGQL